MKKNLQALLLSAFTLFLVSCKSNPLDKKFSDANFASDMRDIVESKKLDQAEATSLTMYIVRAKMTGEKLDNKTYTEILQSAKTLQQSNR